MERAALILAVMGFLVILEALLLYATTSGEFCQSAWSMDMKMEGFKTIWADRSQTGCVVLFVRDRAACVYHKIASQNSTWVVRTRGDFLFAFVMIMLGGVLSEALG